MFLTGDVRIGKSTLIRQALLGFHGKVGGFSCQRLVVPGEDSGAADELPPRWKPKGYRLTAARDMEVLTAAYAEELSDVFLRMTPEGRKWDGSPFETTGVKLLQEALSCDLILLDEIGGGELECKPFMALLDEILKSDIPCLGVVKARDGFAKELKEKYGAQVVVLSGESEESNSTVSGKLREFIEEIS